MQKTYLNIIIKHGTLLHPIVFVLFTVEEWKSNAIKIIVLCLEIIEITMEKNKNPTEIWKGRCCRTTTDCWLVKVMKDGIPKHK